MKQYTVRGNMAAAGSNELVRWEPPPVLQPVSAADVKAVYNFGKTQLDCVKKDAEIIITQQAETHELAIIALKATNNVELSEINNSLERTLGELEIAKQENVRLEALNVSRDIQLKDTRDSSQLALEKLKNSNRCCWFWFMIAVVVLLFVVLMVSVTCYTDHRNSQFSTNTDKLRSLTREMLPHLTVKYKTEFDEKIKELHTNQSFTMVCPEHVISMILNLKTAWDGNEL